MNLPGRRLRLRHHLLHRLHRPRRPDHQHALVDHQRCDRHERLHRIVVELVELRHGAERAGGRHHQRVAVGRRHRDLLGRDRAAGAAEILDHDGLPERRLHALGNQPRGGVGRAAGREADHELDRLVGIGLRVRRSAAPSTSTIDSKTRALIMDFQPVLFSGRHAGHAGPAIGAHPTRIRACAEWSRSGAASHPPRARTARLAAHASPRRAAAQTQPFTV